MGSGCECLGNWKAGTDAKQVIAVCFELKGVQKWKNQNESRKAVYLQHTSECSQ